MLLTSLITDGDEVRPHLPPPDFLFLNYTFPYVFFFFQNMSDSTRGMSGLSIDSLFWLMPPDPATQWRQKKIEPHVSRLIEITRSNHWAPWCFSPCLSTQSWQMRRNIFPANNGRQECCLEYLSLFFRWSLLEINWIWQCTRGGIKSPMTEYNYEKCRPLKNGPCWDRSLRRLKLL